MRSWCCSTSQHLVAEALHTAGGSQHFAAEEQVQKVKQEATARPKVLDMMTDASLSAKLPTLIPAAKQQEYIAAFGSQTKLPRTPLLSGYK